MKTLFTPLSHFVICALLAGLAPVCLAAETDASSSAKVIVGDPAKAGELPAAILSAYAKGARDITISPGIYRIPPIGKCAISLEHWRDATLHAARVTLVFEELTQRPIRLSRCDHVTLEGATLRFAEPSFTQGRIKAIGEDVHGKYLDWQIDAGYPIFDPLRSMLDVVDQNTRLLKAGTGDVGCQSVESSGPGRFRLRRPNGLLGSAAVNDWLFTRRPGGGDSIVHLDACAHCTMQGLTLQNSGFAAFFETGGDGGHLYADCRVSPGPKPAGATEEQLVGCGADGFHSAGTRIGPTLERCAWEGLLHDDCIAIHGSLQKVERAEGTRLVLEKGNRGGFAVGEPVRISSEDGYFGEFTCTAMRTLDHDGGLLELSLNRESGAPPGARASNPRCDGAGYRILNCTLGNCRSRGILVKADNGLIQGCAISGCGMSAISIGPEYWWGEADYSQHVTVKGNTLRNNVLNGSEAGVIFVHGDGAMGNTNLAITDNLFDQNYGQIAIHAEDTDGIRISDNRFVTSPALLPGKARTILDFKSTRNVILQRNMVKNPGKNDTLVSLGKRVEGVTGNDPTGIAVATPKPDASDATVTPHPGNAAALMPAHGTVSLYPAKRWEDSLATGNGIMGALLAGDPEHETLIVNHCKLWLPLGSREALPVTGQYLPEMRRIIAEKGYDEAQKFFEAKAREQGWGGQIIWTDPFHPGLFFTIDQPAGGDISDYLRVEDFSTGEVRVQWRNPEGAFSRRVFVSRVDNVIVVKLAAPEGKLNCRVRVEKPANKLIESTLLHAKGMVTCHSIYVNGKGGYDAAVRVATQGGTTTSDGESIAVTGANSALLVLRIEAWKTPLPGSEAWPYSPDNPQFVKETATKSQKAAREYRSQWMEDLKQALAGLPADYDALFLPHAKAHGEIFNRVTVDLGGAPAERALATEPLLDLAKKESRLPAALLERMYDAGRYEFICAAGPDTPPNLFGIWTGTWAPAWSGDYTLDTNIQLDIESAFSGNMAECMGGYFKLMEEFVPDFQANAKKLYGCRGILSGSRASNLGLHLHWGSGWPGQFWTPGASWLAHWFYDYYQYTGDVDFLRDHAVPYMKQCALFWEDFLKGAGDVNGRFCFSPSFSAENGWGDNSSQDIAIARELLTNLIAACETLRIEGEGVGRWKAMLAKLPPYLINDEGQLKEWSTPNKGENNNHRHLMHLYGAFESQEFSEEADPKLFQAARVALRNRLRESKETATHGRMHMGLARRHAGDGKRGL